MQPRLAVLLLIVVTASLHFPSYPADFSFDDVEFVVLNESIRSFDGALETLATTFPPQAVDTRSSGRYRPLTSLSYALDYQLYGIDAWGFHVSNVVLYSVLVLVVAWLAYGYRRSILLAFSAGLIFAAHPVHCEVVDGVAGRSELLSLLFALTSLALFVRALDGYARRRWLLAGSVVCYALSCLAKETGVVLPAILALHLLLFWRRPDIEQAGRARGRELWLLAPHGLVLVLYLAMRMNAIQEFAYPDPVLGEASLWGRLHTIGVIFLEYLRLLFAPGVLQIDYYYQHSVGVQSGASARSWTGLLSLCGLVGLLGWLGARSIIWPRARTLLAPPSPDRDEEQPARYSDADLVLVSLTLFFAFLFPVSHVMDIGALMAERFLFAPSVAFALLLALAGARAVEQLPIPKQRQQWVAATLLSLLVLVFGIRSNLRAAEWRDSVALWRSAVRHLPGDHRVHGELGLSYLERGSLVLAERELRQSISLQPTYREGLMNLAVLQTQREQFAEAEAIYQQLLETSPRDAEAWTNLGVIEILRERHAVAAKHFEHALALNPNLATARQNLAYCLRRVAANTYPGHSTAQPPWSRQLD